jgi:hypothetical protein
MPEGYGYSPEGIRQYLEDLAKKHGILPPDVPPADNRDIVNKGFTRPPTGANLGDPLEFTMNPETGERIPTERTGRVQGPHISEVGPSQRIPSTQRRTLGQQPRQQPPQPPGLQRPPVAGARELGAAGLPRALSGGLAALGGMGRVTEGDIKRFQAMSPEGMAGGGMVSPTPFSFEQLQSLLSGSDGTKDEMERQRQQDVLRDFNRRSRSMRTGR